MPILAIAKKERSNLERRGWTPWLRALYVCILGFLALAEGASRSFSGGHPDGLRMFMMLAGAQFFLAAVLCPLVAAGSIAVERSEGTLPLLLVTACRRRDIVLGKALGIMAYSGLALLASTPLLVLTIALGGVNARHVGAAVLYIALTLAGVTMIGVLCSAKAKRAQDVSGSALLFSFLWLWLPSIAAAVGFRVPLWLDTSPLICFQRTVGIGFGAAPAPWAALAATGAIVLLAFWRATKRIGLADKALGKAKGQPRAKRTARPRKPRRWLVSRLFWDASLSLTKVEWFAFVLMRWAAVLTAAVFLVLVLVRSDLADKGAFIFILGTLWMVLALTLPLMCVRLLLRRKADRSLPLLLTTPVSPHRIILAHVWGLTFLAMPVLLSLAVVYALGEYAGGSGYYYAGVYSPVLIGLSAILRVCTGWIALMASSLVALFFSALCRTYAAALTATILVFLLSGCLSMFFWGQMVVFMPSGGMIPRAIFTIVMSGGVAGAMYAALTSTLRSWSQRV